MSVADVYNKIATDFKNTRHYKWEWVTKFVDNLKRDNTVNVLDIGCGAGRNIISYSDDTVKIKGIDLSREFVHICKNEGLDVDLGDMIRMPYADEQFDNLLVIASFHHLETVKIREDALREMWRILKPNGTALISVWSKNQPNKTKRKFDTFGDQMVSWKNLSGIEYFRYYYIFEIEELKSLFIDANFEIISHSWECGNEVFIIEKKI